MSSVFLSKCDVDSSNADISTSEDAFSNPAVACVLLHCLRKDGLIISSTTSTLGLQIALCGYSL